MAELVNGFMQEHSIEPDFIASHGHTIFHDPSRRFTSQIGCGAALATGTGFPVIDNFRAQDISIDGEGAPVAPIADQLLFAGYDFYMNIGGIANISCNAKGRFVAFDIGPANQILDALAGELDLAYDIDGRIAAQGKTVDDLVQKIDTLPYFQQAYPKSLDNQWVQQVVLPIYQQDDASVADRLHTACIQLAKQTAKAIHHIIEKEKLQKPGYQLFISGGGTFNRFLVEAICTACNAIHPVEVVLPEPSIIEFKEAILMALMGVLRLENRPNCLASVTGAMRDTIGGSIHQGYRKKV